MENKEKKIKDSTIIKFLNKFKDPYWTTIDFSVDTDKMVAQKRTIWELNHCMCLKENNLWWKEDEDRFISKHGCTTNSKNLINEVFNYFNERSK